MRLRPEVWEATLESANEEVRATIPMILALHQIDIGTSSLSDEAIDELDEIAPDLIPGMVLTLNQCAKSETPTFGDRDLGTTMPSRSKVGRNEPCPCGSGKKHEKCCASVTLH